MDRKTLIRRGNIVTTGYIENPETGCYLGNGRFGAVMSGLGLNMSPEMQKRNMDGGESQYMHIQHWGRFHGVSENIKSETTADYLVPLIKMHWEEEPNIVSHYRQCQDFYDGVLETSFELNNKTQVRVLNWFDMVNKNLAGIRLYVSYGIQSVKASALLEFVPYPYLCGDTVHQKISIERVEDNWCITIRCEDTCNNLSSSVYFYSTTPVECCKDGLRFLASQGKHDIFISYGKPVQEEDIKHSLARTKKRWNEIWNTGGWFDFSDENAQKMWVRSMAYLVSTFDDDLGIIQPTNGFTGNIFPFNFVQDMQYVCPAFMMTGHMDIVKRWVEKFHGMIEDMRGYAKALWPEAQGIYPPWELPYGGIKGYHEPSPPVIFCYEPHNAGFLCRMAKEAADYVNDTEWTTKIVHPLVDEICRFYKSFCRKGKDGFWHLEWYPCVGQDEAGGRNKKDYLCCLYSAKYCFQTAVLYGLDRDGSYEAILTSGLAFERLMSERGTYHTAYQADDFGKQKHPVQLNGVAYFPSETAPLSQERMAYELRHEITARAKEPFFFGWTLGEFLLAGSNLKDVQGWRNDWDEIKKSNYTDNARMQIYETSGARKKAFYMTTHGLILQSLMRNYINDYWGCLEIASCKVFDEVRFGNITSGLGVMVTGIVKEELISLELTAWKDCELLVNGSMMSFKQGERKSMYL